MPRHRAGDNVLTEPNDALVYWPIYALLGMGLNMNSWVH